ncbi:7 transmembrane receptor, partial [Ostertagia ostertagi]
MGQDIAVKFLQRRRWSKCVENSADLLIAVFCIPFSYWQVLIFDDQRWVFGSAMCSLLSFLQGIAVFLSSWTLVVISFDRWMAIMFVMSPSMRLTRKRAVYLVLATWAFSRSMALPLFLVSRIHVTDGIKRCDEDWAPVEAVVPGLFYPKIGKFLANFKFSRFLFPFLHFLVPSTLFVPYPGAAICGATHGVNHHLYIHWNENVEQSNSWTNEFDDEEGGDGAARKCEKVDSNGDSYLGHVCLLLAASFASHQRGHRSLAKCGQLEIHPLHMVSNVSITRPLYVIPEVVFPWLGNDAFDGESDSLFSSECSFPRRFPLLLTIS